MSRQYLAVKFRPTDRRPYTYHNDGAPVRVGEKVKIADRLRLDEWSAAEVVAIVYDRPPFETKAILGRVDSVPPTQGALSI